MTPGAERKEIHVTCRPGSSGTVDCPVKLMSAAYLMTLWPVKSVPQVWSVTQILFSDDFFIYICKDDRE